MSTSLQWFMESSQSQSNYEKSAATRNWVIISDYDVTTVDLWANCIVNHNTGTTLYIQNVVYVRSRINTSERVIGDDNRSTENINIRIVNRFNVKWRDDFPSTRSLQPARCFHHDSGSCSLWGASLSCYEGLLRSWQYMAVRNPFVVKTTVSLPRKWDRVRSVEFIFQLIIYLNCRRQLESSVKIMNGEDCWPSQMK
jgi:hypothetical protein